MSIRCRISGETFSFSEPERQLYATIGVPPPTVCPDERARRRLAWRNERTLYRRTCDATGKTIVSIFDSGTPFPVFSQEYWWSDAWDPLAFGRMFDLTRPFFPQFAAIFNAVPQCALRCPQSENCEYTNQCEKNKDCYLVFCSNGSRECLHGMWYQTCVDCVDCTYLEESELCYEVLNGKNCYRCTDCDNVQNCADCHFSRDLIGCNDCLGCVNLRNKRYCLFNEQLSQSDYLASVEKFGLHAGSTRKQFAEQCATFTAQFPYKYYSGRNNETFTGDYLENNKIALACYNCRNSEQIYYCRDAWSGRNSIDLTETLEQDFCVELEGCYKNVNSGFSAKISETHDTWYCSHCFNSRDLFGCVGLKQKQFCILNRQYSKEEYFSLRAKIVEQMRLSGEWGEYLPAEYSPFVYNESVACEYFPLTREEVLERGLRWKDQAAPSPVVQDARVADSIRGVNDNILDQTIVCEFTGRSFRLQRTELLLYRKLELPLPRLHPDERHRRRMDRRNPRKLSARSCSQCGTDLLSTFPPEIGRNVLCESCYGQAVD